MLFEPAHAARNSAWHRLQRRLAQDLYLRAGELRLAVRADSGCWLVRAHSNESYAPRDGRPGHPQKVA